MGSQPNLASRLEVVSSAVKNYWGGPPPKFVAQKNKILDHFFRSFLTQHCISPERNVTSTNKNASVNLQFVP